MPCTERPLRCGCALTPVTGPVEPVALVRDPLLVALVTESHAAFAAGGTM